MDELTGTSVSELADTLNLMESNLKKGESAKLQIVSSDMPDSQTLNQFYRDSASAGFHISKPRVKVIDGFPVTELTITKGSPQWALLIPLIPTALIVGLIAFGIVKIEAISKALVPLLLIGGGVVVAVIAAISTSPRVAEVAKAVRR